MHLPVTVRQAADGSYTAQAVGIPELKAIASDRVDAMMELRRLTLEWVERGELTGIPLFGLSVYSKASAPIDPNEPAQLAFLKELARRRREDLEQTLAEYETECSGISSTPTT